MTDVRSLLKNERASRRVQHKHASYSTGSLLCIVCHLQIKSESLWEGHLRSPGHILRQEKIESHEADQSTADLSILSTDANNKKRKAGDEDGTIRKRNKPERGIPAGFFDATQEPVESRPILPSPTAEFQIPSRPATPSKPTLETPKRLEVVDEDEWAAFEADIAAADAVEADNDAVISAPAMTAAELAAKSLEESNTQRKERQEAEIEGDKEDAARKLEDELEEMESLEQRVKRLRDKREELRKKESLVGLNQIQAPLIEKRDVLEEEEEEDDEDDDDEWDGFRMR